MDTLQGYGILLFDVIHVLYS